MTCLTTILFVSYLYNLSPTFQDLSPLPSHQDGADHAPFPRDREMSKPGASRPGASLTK